MLGKSNSTYYFEQKMLSTHLITNLSAFSEKIAFALEEKYGTFGYEKIIQREFPK